MYTKALLVLLSAATVSLASPLSIPQPRQRDVSAMSLPSSALPAPAANLKLKFIALGLGTQNYTCNTPDAAAVPASNGARADLYNANQLFGPNADINAQTMKVLPGLALSMTQGKQGAIPQPWMQALPQLGQHFFTPALVPTFDLSSQGGVFSGKKAANSPAPADSCPGLEKEGAVDWLQLTDAGTSSGNLAGGIVYRVETAGGKAPTTCAGMQGKTKEVSYGAEYWVYAP